MDAVLLDPMAALEAAGEGTFEFAHGRLIPMTPASHDHIRKSSFLASLLQIYVEERGAGLVVADGFAQRLDSGTVRVPDLAYFRPESLPRVNPTFSEGGADLVVEVVSLDSQARDRGEKFVEYETAGVEEYWIVDPMSAPPISTGFTKGFTGGCCRTVKGASRRRLCPASGFASIGSGILPPLTPPSGNSASFRFL